MKHEKVRSNKDIVELNQQAPGPSLEELQRSHHIVEALMGALPSDTKKELIDLLQTLAKGNGSQIVIDSAHQRALQIVSDICKPNSPYEIEDEANTQETGERRQRERRQK